MSQQPVTVRGVTLGSGIPKICVPLTGESQKELLSQAEELRHLPADVAEWRCDWYKDISDPGAVKQTLRALREELGNIPLLFTFRTAGEGGHQGISPDEYVSLLTMAVKTGCVDLVDTELFLGQEVFQPVLEAAHGSGVYVIASSHDFQETPEKSEMLDRLSRMEQWGADIAKLAVMPHDPEDVLALLEVTTEASSTLHIPLITMSMSGLGTVSRLSGEIFGSCMTFGSAGTSSAPGQVEVRKLSKVLEMLHKAR